MRANVIHLTNSAVVKQFPAAQCIQQRLFGAFSSSINKSNNVGDIAQRKIFGYIASAYSAIYYVTD